MSTETDETVPQPKPEPDAFFARIRAAWDECEAYWTRTTNGESPGPEENPATRLGQEFFDTYLARRPDGIACDAAGTAFNMWMNTERPWGLIEPALAQIGDDGAALSAVLPATTYALRREGREDEIDAMIERLLARMQDDEQRSRALRDLVRSWMWSGEAEKARAACERIIAWDASESTVRYCRGCLHELDNLNVGQMAPVFRAHTLDGRDLNLADLRGGPVLLDFWATWCSPCRGEFPHLRRVHQAFSDKGLSVLSISLDEDCDEARRMIEKEQLTWMHVCEGWSESRLAKLYNVLGIPTTYLIGPDGKIVGKKLREHELDEAIGALLG